MANYQRKTTPKLDCSIEKTLHVIAGKWKPAILNELLQRKLRLKEIQEGLPDAAKRSLTQQLAEMQQDGLIQKEDFNQYPKKTEYSLTPLGKQLAPVFAAMREFGDQLVFDDE